MSSAERKRQFAVSSATTKRITIRSWLDKARGELIEALDGTSDIGLTKLIQGALNAIGNAQTVNNDLDT